MPEMAVLAIETSQREGGVALAMGERVLVERLSPKKRHDDDLIPAIDRMFSRALLRPTDLGAVGVSIGPGGFTGLRIAISTAKMLVEAGGARLAAVPTALVAAETLTGSGSENAGRSPQATRGGEMPAIPGERPILVLLASKGESAWATRCQSEEGGAWSIIARAGLADARSLDLCDISLVLADRYLPEPMRRRCEDQGIQIAAPVIDPVGCLRVTQRMLQRDETIDPLRLLPLYPREPEAVALWRQSHPQ